MQIKISNIGKIKEADVTINGITVIAGENNTGKSTVGKVLYAMFNSFVDVKKKVEQERIDSLYVGIFTLMQELNLSNVAFTKTNVSMLVSKLNSLKDNINRESVKEILIDELNIGQNITQSNENSFVKRVDNIVRTLNVDDSAFLRILIQNNFDAEFRQQINNSLEKNLGLIELCIKSNRFSVSFEHNNLMFVYKKVDIFSEAIYLDDPFIIDINPNVGFEQKIYNFGHKEKLAKLLYTQNSNNNLVDKIVVAKRLEKILKKLHTVCMGKTFFKDNNELMYQQDNIAEPFKVANLSTGLKTFVILQTLLLNGAIKDGSLIILDEPEIHLHPEWQLLFAELIVMLQKEFNLHILLNTHSPYFLQAIEVFAEKYGIDDKCEYYLSYNEHEESFVKRVTGNLEEIYAKLARPLQVLENLRYADDK